MRMAANQLLIDGIQGVVDAKQVFFGGHLGEENSLQQEIAELVGQLRPIARIDGVHHLVSLFQKKRLDGVEVLLAIPRAATWRAQAGHQIDKLLKFFTGCWSGHQRRTKRTGVRFKFNIGVKDV